MKKEMEETIEVEEEEAMTMVAAGEPLGMTDQEEEETKEATAEEAVATEMEAATGVVEAATGVVAAATEKESKMTQRTPNCSWVDLLEMKLKTRPERFSASSESSLM